MNTSKRISTLAVLFSIVMLLTSALVAEATVGVGDTGPEVTEVQEALNEGGWPTIVDGRFGPRTRRTVIAFQKANGLTPDGIVGPVTAAALAVRLDTPVVPPPAPTKTYSGPCAEYAGMLEFFSPGWSVSTMQGIMNRESRCNPGVTSRTNCCHGLLQIHQMHIPYLGPCQVYSVADLFVPERNICSAAILYRRAGGMSPWHL